MGEGEEKRGFPARLKYQHRTDGCREQRNPRPQGQPGVRVALSLVRLPRTLAAKEGTRQRERETPCVRGLCTLQTGQPSEGFCLVHNHLSCPYYWHTQHACIHMYVYAIHIPSHVCTTLMHPHPHSHMAHVHVHTQLSHNASCT